MRGAGKIKDYYGSVREAAIDLGVSSGTILRWIEEGRLTDEEVGRGLTDRNRVKWVLDVEACRREFAASLKANYRSSYKTRIFRGLRVTGPGDVVMKIADLPTIVLEALAVEYANVVNDLRKYLDDNDKILSKYAWKLSEIQDELNGRVGFDIDPTSMTPAQDKKKIIAAESMQAIIDKARASLHDHGQEVS